MPRQAKTTVNNLCMKCLGNRISRRQDASAGAGILPAFAQVHLRPHFGRIKAQAGRDRKMVSAMFD
jgi:hypothetical protein